MILCAHHLLSHSPSPSDGEIREALGGNLCRCTGYQHIVNAVRSASRKMAKPPKPSKTTKARTRARAR
jgi:carbon-monoxide dehydrogenase small subunit